MNKRTLVNAMSREKKAFAISVAKFAKLNQSSEESAPTNSVAANDGDPLSSTRTSTPELLVEMHKTDSDTVMENPTAFGDVIILLKRILDKQDRLEARMIKLETTINDLVTSTEQNKRSKAEDMARDKVMRECKVLTHKVHKAICRLTGEDQDDAQIDIAASLPISTLEAAHDINEKMRNKKYRESMKLYLIQKKASRIKFDSVLRNLYSDEFLSHCNWEGKSGKHALMQFSLASELLYECFDFPDRGDFDTAMRQYISRSHNRMKHVRRNERIKMEESKSSNPEVPQS